jgi:hypothetical protein
MALYKGTALIRQIIGRLGENDFLRWRNLNVVRMSPVTVTDPNSLGQQLIRASIADSSTNWYSTLDSAQRAEWETYARNWPREEPTPAGIRRIIPKYVKPQSGINAYQMVNAILESAGLARVDNAPLVADQIAYPPPIAVAYDSLTDTLTISWTDPAVHANDYLRVWIDSEQEIFHKQILIDGLGARSILLSTATVDALAIRGALGAPVLFASIENSTVYIQADVVNLNGRRSGPGETVKLTLA